MKTKLEIAQNWLPRYTGMQLDDFGDYMLLTNFGSYVKKFAEQFNCDISGEGRTMQASTNSAGLSLINFGMGSANAATIMDLLIARNPKGILFLGKCGGLKKSTELGNFILPTAAIRGEGTSNDYMPPEVPALPSFKLHKFVSDKVLQHNLEYRTGVVYTSNRRVWEWDENFKNYLQTLGAIGIDMETATIFIVGYANQIARGAFLLVSDLPMHPDGVKTEESDEIVTQNFVDLHLKIGIEAMTDIDAKGERIKHFTFWFIYNYNLTGIIFETILYANCNKNIIYGDVVKKIVMIQIVLALLLINSVIAQNQLKENEVKSQLTKIFDLSKDQNYSGVAALFLYNKDNVIRAFNYANKSDAKVVKRMAKKIKAYIDLSDSYEYESITYGKIKNLPSADLKVSYRSGDQKLSISFLFVEHSGNVLLTNFK